MRKRRSTYEKQDFLHYNFYTIIPFSWPFLSAFSRCLFSLPAIALHSDAPGGQTPAWMVYGGECTRV